MNIQEKIDEIIKKTHYNSLEDDDYLYSQLVDFKNFILSKFCEWIDIKEQLPQNPEKKILYILIKTSKNNELKVIGLYPGYSEEYLKMAMIINFVTHWKYIDIEDVVW